MTAEQLQEVEEKCKLMESWLRSMPALGFKMHMRRHLETNGTLEEWADRLINIYCAYMDTWQTGGENNFGDTIYSHVQCEKERHRGIDDLYRITINYRPNTKFIDFLEAVITIGNEQKIASLFCNNVRKRVYRPKRDNYHRDEFKIPWEYFLDINTDSEEKYNLNFKLLREHYEEKAKATERIPANDTVTASKSLSSTRDAA